MSRISPLGKQELNERFYSAVDPEAAFVTEVQVGFHQVAAARLVARHAAGEGKRRLRILELGASACLFASSPHQFEGEAAPGYDRLYRACKQAVYSSDCYHYGLVASGFGDIAAEARLAIYDFLAVVPVVEGAGGVITEAETQNSCGVPAGTCCMS